MLKEFRDLLPQAVKYKVDRTMLTKLQNIALKHLDLKNMNHIRDKFEGQAYLDKFLMKSYAEVALQRILEKKFLSLVEKENKNYKPEFRIGDKKVEIVIFDFQTFPLIPNTEFDIAAFVFVNLEYRETTLLGFASKDALEVSVDSMNLTPIQARSSIGVLKNLKIIEPLENFKQT